MVGVLSILLASLLQVVPAGPSYLSQKSARDSVFVADKVQYGFELKDVAEGTEFELPDLSTQLDRSIEISGGWKEQVLGRSTKNGNQVRDIRYSISLQPFDEKDYELPELSVVRHLPDGTADTLVFDPSFLHVAGIQIDTTFTVHDIKGQDVLQTTLSDILEDIAPWAAIALGAALLVLVIFLAVRFILKRRSVKVAPADPAHVVALRALEGYRSETYWVDEKQKAFYSGITDALRAYIASRFGIDAVEMTSADIFAALKGDDSIPLELFIRTKNLFELADFVKFAKHLASKEENAAAVPTAVEFVMKAYQTELAAEAAKTTKEVE